MAKTVDLEKLEAQKAKIDRQLEELHADKRELAALIDEEYRRQELERKLGGLDETDRALLAQMIGVKSIEPRETFGQAKS